MITLTPRALERIRLLKTKTQMPEGMLKIGLQGGGCSGFIFQIEFTSNLVSSDRMIIVEEETEEAILVDKRSYPYLQEMEIDYTGDLINGGFKFLIPGAKECSCGSSFNSEP